MTKGTPKTVHVQYFAMLREHRGCPSETVQTQTFSARELYLELQERHGLRLPTENVKLAVNDEFRNWDIEISDGDRLSFLPPVAGG